MGVGWRRFSERFHQSMPLTSSGALKPTSNARCSTMLQEATNFTAHLKRCEKAIGSMMTANHDAAATISLVMTAPLPRQWEETAAASGGAASPGVKPIGSAAFNAEAMATAFQEAGHKTETEVLAPLTRWHDVYQQLETRFRDLERIRLELDSRRRTVADLTHKVESMRGRLSQGGDAKKEAALQDCTKLLQHKEAKLQATTATFVESECLLQRDLATLVRDAAYLRLYAAAAMRLQGHAMLAGAEAFGPMPPGSPPPASKVAAIPGPPATTPTMHTPASSANKPSMTGVHTPEDAPHDRHAVPGSATLATS